MDDFGVRRGGAWGLSVPGAGEMVGLLLVGVRG